MDVLQNALTFASHGWHLFPAKWLDDKHVGLVKWGVNTTTDPDTINKWNTRWPDAYFCVDLRKSDLTVLDVDIKKGKDGAASYEKLILGRIPPLTMESETPSGGWHLFFKGESPVTTEKLGPGLDTPVMVPLPNSTVPGKGTYKVKRVGHPIPVPTWITNPLQNIDQTKKADRDIPITELDKPNNIQRAIDYLRDKAPEAVEGSGGDSTTYQVACRLRDFAISDNQALGLMIEYWNSEKAYPPWTPDDLEVKVRSAYAHAKDRPGNATMEALFPEFRSTNLIKCASDIQPEKIKPRDWLLGHRYLKDTLP